MSKKPASLRPTPAHPGQSAGPRMRPMNLIARFLLEIAALIAAGYWGYQQSGGALRYVLAVGIPLLIAVLWGVFAVPGDPSRSGKAPVPVQGWLRLILELAVFAFAAFAMYATGMETLALLFAAAVAVHYFASIARIRWLLNQG